MTNEASKPANPYATGGGGSDFENQVAAVYLASVLLRTTPRGFDAGQADEVRLQRGFQGEPLDDLIVFAVLPDARAKLSLQIKRDVTYGARDETFNKIVSAVLGHFFTAPRFQPRARSLRDRVRAVREGRRRALSGGVGIRTDERVRRGLPDTGYRTWTVQSPAKLPWHLMRGRLDVAAGEPISDDEVWHFLRAMVILRFDVQQEGSSADRTNIVAILATFASPRTAFKLPAPPG